MGHISLTGISSRAWEHPADRAALESLRRIPGADYLLRKLMQTVSDKPLNLLMQASAIEVGPNQFPKIYVAYKKVLETLDAPEYYPLYISQNTVINAGAGGFQQPFITLNSGLVHSLTDSQLAIVLGHEVGHILSGHVVYKTLIRLFLRGGVFLARMPLAGLPLLGVLAALLEWDRKSELSADRAALLATQDPDALRSTLLHLAGGVREGASIEAFREQAKAYREEKGPVSQLVKLMALLGRTHPFPVHRLHEIEAWIESGDYQKILDGEYPHRAEEERTSLWKEWSDSMRGYGDDVASATAPAGEWFRDKGAAVKEQLNEMTRFMRR